VPVKGVLAAVANGKGCSAGVNCHYGKRLYSVIKSRPTGANPADDPYLPEQVLFFLKTLAEEEAA
jgi:hypothetical protein